MEEHFTLDDATFIWKFEHCELPQQLFTHEAHLRLAWIHIKQYGYEKTLITIPIQLKAYVGSLKEEEKYNTTLTIAAIKAVYHFILRSNAMDFSNFIAEFPQLKYEFKALMKTHYSFDIFNNAIAKREFLTPDLVPFY